MVELVVYSLGEVLILVINTETVLNVLYIFDTDCEGCDYVKDCILLAIATAMAISVLIMDLFYRIF